MPIVKKVRLNFSFDVDEENLWDILKKRMYSTDVYMDLDVNGATVILSKMTHSIVDGKEVDFEFASGACLDLKKDGIKITVPLHLCEGSVSKKDE